MGQANSRGAPDPRPRTRLPRPASWAPSLSPPPQPAADTVPELQQQHHLHHHHQQRSRPASQRFNPFNVLATPPDRSGAASPAPDAVFGARRRSRITRARSSLSSLPGLLQRRLSTRSRHVDHPHSTSPPPARPSPSRSTLRHTTSTGYEPGPFLPRVQVPGELDLNFDELPNNTTEHSHPRLSRLSPARRDGRALIPSFRPDRSLRSMTSSLRRRRSPTRGDEDQAAMLSRLLSVAAAATAASLMGDDHRAVSEARNVAGDGEDGTFDSFLQALQNGRIASALRQSGNNESEEAGDAPDGNPAPLNFFRMFRFGSSAGARRSETRSGSRGTSSNNREGEEDGEGRMVPIIIVGIRSINPGSGSGQDDNIPPFLDALSTFPTPLTSPGDNNTDGMLRTPQNGTRFSHRRRASMGGMNSFPSNYDSQRHYRGPDRPRPWSTLADSPSGPLPPPSTPASSGLSAVSSGANTPTFSASPPSPITQSTAPSRRGSFVRRPTVPGLEPTDEDMPTHHRSPRQRRLSESDFTRYGSGASRRNGVVEPDHNPGEGSRSWIIYVLGGSYPENHPILTTPSLFTDSPTYEDMLLLSTMLGPAKAPVATAEDVAAAPGLFRIQNLAGTLVAEAMEGSEVLRLATGARCLVCLSDFEDDDESRRLVKCGHLFHRLCIDQWLTTGRNSCPLCRGLGVDEKPTERSQNSSPDLSDAPGPPAAV